MNPLQAAKEALTALVRILPAPKPRGFTCGDCEQSDRCGRPPSANCLARAAQIARYGNRPRRPPTIVQC